MMTSKPYLTKAQTLQQEIEATTKQIKAQTRQLNADIATIKKRNAEELRLLKFATVAAALLLVVLVVVLWTSPAKQCLGCEVLQALLDAGGQP